MTFYHCNWYTKEKLPIAPQVEFPRDWHITYSSTHWSNETTMKEYVDQIILPYIKRKRAELKLAPNHASLLLFENFKAQWTEQLLTYINSHNVYVRSIDTAQLHR